MGLLERPACSGFFQMTPAGPEAIKNGKIFAARGVTVAFYSLESCDLELVRWVHTQPQMRAIRVQTPSESSYKRLELLFYVMIHLSIDFWAHSRQHSVRSCWCAASQFALSGQS